MKLNIKNGVVGTIFIKKKIIEKKNASKFSKLY